MQPSKKTTDKPNVNVDDILRRSREAAARARKIDEGIKRVEQQSVISRVSETAKNLKLVADVISATRVGLQWANENILQPVIQLPYVGPALAAPFKYTFKAYYAFTHPYEGETLWQATKNIVTNPLRRRGNDFLNLFRKDKKPFAPDERERGPLAKHRAGVAALMSAWALTGVLKVPVAGDSFNYLVQEPAVDVVRMVATSAFNGVAGHGFGLTHDTLYFGVPSKETGDDIYHVNGSTQIKADESNSVSFEVRDRLVHEIWSWTNGHGPFRPDYVVGPIRPDANKCDTVSYGSRLRIARWASFKPDMLSVSCKPSGGLAAPVATPP